MSVIEHLSSTRPGLALTFHIMSPVIAALGLTAMLGLNISACVLRARKGMRIRGVNRSVS
jgi:hypothetical protein